MMRSGSHDVCLTLVFVILVLVMPATSSALAPIFGPAAMLNTNASTDSGDDFGVRLATDGGGRWVAVWRSEDSLAGTIGSDRDILVATSSTGGVAWSVPQALNSTAAGDAAAADSAPALATDGAGTWIAVWESDNTLGGTVGSDFDILVARSTDNGASWSVAAALNTNAASDSGDDRNVQIATDGTGHWLVVWDSSDSLAGTIGTDLDILVASSSDGGQSWTAPVAVNTTASADTGSDTRPQILAGAASTWIAAWESTEDLAGSLGTDFDIFVSRSITDGASWSSASALNTNASSDSGGDRNVALASDGAGSVVAVWRSTDKLGKTIGNDEDILVASSSNNGGSWSAVQALNTNAGSDAGSDRHPRVATDGQGTWVTAWESDENLGGSLGNDFDILLTRSTDGGVSWSAPEALSEQATGDLGGDFNVDLTSDGSFGWVAVWGSTDDFIGTIGTDRDILVAVPVNVCGAVPLLGCRQPTRAGRGQILLKDQFPDRKDLLNWKWLRGEQTVTSEFGSPDVDTDYTLCLYDSSGPGGADVLVQTAFAPAAGSCGGRPCWKRRGTKGWRYSDPDLTPAGIKSINLREGGPGKAKIVLKGKGAGLGLPTLPLAPKLTVQLKASSGVCWQAEYSSPLLNGATKLRARPD